VGGTKEGMAIGRPPFTPMTEEMLFKYTQPVLLAMGLMVALNLWNIIQAFLNARKDKDSKTEKAIEKLNESVNKLSFHVEQLEKDVNNIGQMVRNLKNE